MRAIVEKVRGMAADEGGQNIVEYGLLLVFIAAVVFFFLYAGGRQIGQIFGKTTNNVEQGVDVIR